MDNGKEVGHDFVDLGLESGLLWATRNIGADYPEEYGDYFAWGETETKMLYSWATYFDNPSGDGSTFFKYKIKKEGQNNLNLRMMSQI